MSCMQAATLRRSPEVVVATPGRLIDHLRNSQGVGLEDLAVLVMDEADRWGCIHNACMIPEHARVLNMHDGKDGIDTGIVSPPPLLQAA